MDEIIKNIIYKLKYGSQNEIKEAKLGIKKLWDKSPRSFDRYALIFLKEAQSFDVISNPRNQAAIVEALYFSYLSLAGRKHSEDLNNFILKAVVYSNGNVRKAAINLASWLRCSIDKNNPDEDRKYKQFMQELDRLIEKYKYEAPNAKYISEIKTSVYKSLRMLRDECARGIYAEKIANSPELARATKENDSFFDEPDESNPLPDILAHNVTKQTLELLYRDVRGRVCAEIVKFGFLNQDVIDFEKWVAKDTLVGDNNGSTTDGFIEFFYKYTKKYPKAKMDEFNPIARALQAISNHYVGLLINGKSASHFLINIITSRWENYRHKPDNLENFICLVKKAHELIDVFLKQEQVRLNSEYRSFQSRMRMFNLSAEELSNRYKTSYQFHPQYFSVTHHILDWYAQISPWGVNQKTPEKLAALAIYLTDRINLAAGHFGSYPLNRDNLAKFGGWKGLGSLHSAVTYGPFYDVLRNVHDPDLLLFDSLEVPKNWKKKLGLSNNPKEDYLDFSNLKPSNVGLEKNDEMPLGAFIPFGVRHFEESQKEIMTLVIKENKFGVQLGIYPVLENYCIEKECDCRKAMLNIYNLKNSQIMATIGYGWEDQGYYIKWYGADDSFIKEIVGSYLEPGGIQSEQADIFLELWRDLILKNHEYRDQIRRHYNLFKEGIGLPVKNNIKLGRNDPCWCGSGKKYKKCHGA